MVQFKSLLYSFDAGDTISVRYIKKGGGENTIDITLAEMPEEYR